MIGLEGVTGFDDGGGVGVLGGFLDGDGDGLDVQ